MCARYRWRIFIALVLAPWAVGLAGVRVAGLATPPAGRVLSIPIDGFTPMVVMAVTDEADQGTGGIFSDADTFAWYRPWLAGTIEPAGSQQFSVVLYDTGANVNLLTYEDWNSARAMTATSDTYEVEGAGPDSVTARILGSYGFFVDGLDAIESGTVDTSGMQGVGNVRALGAMSSGSVLPSVIGTPLSMFYTTVIRTDQNRTITYAQQEHTSPRVDLYTSRYADGVPRTFDHRIAVSYFQDGATLPPLYIDGEGSLGILQSTPTASDALMVDNVVVEDSDYQPRTTGGRFLFDTGAQVTVVSLDLAYDLGLDPESPEFTVPITGVGGSIEETPGFVVDTLRLPASGLGDMVLHDVPVIALNVPTDDSPVDGIVGMNLFTDRNLVIHGGYGAGSGSFSGPFVGVTAVNPPGPATYCFGQTGSWSNSEVWNEQPPDADHNAYVEFGGQVSLGAQIGQARSLWLGRLNNGSGTLSMTGGAELRIASALHLGRRSALQAEAGSRIMLGSGSRFENESVDAVSLGGLANVELVFEGGPDESRLEVASSLALPENGDFAMASLILGSQSQAWLHLEDDFDNLADGPGNEILSLSNLEILSSSVLDLGSAGVWVANWDAEDPWLADLLAQGQIVSDRFVGLRSHQGGALLVDAFGGDLDLNGLVDEDDFAVLSNAYGQAGTWSQGDLNYDGLVDFADYVILARNFGSGQAPPVPVPEPASAAFLLAGGLFWLGRRRP